MNEKMNMSMEIKSEWIEAFKNVFDLCEIKRVKRLLYYRKVHQGALT